MPPSIAVEFALSVTLPVGHVVSLMLVHAGDGGPVVLPTAAPFVAYSRIMYGEPYCTDVAFPLSSAPVCGSNVGTTINTWLASLPTVTCTEAESLGAFVPSPVLCL